MPILLDIDNTDPKAPIFMAGAAGALKAAAEAQMAATITKYVQKSKKADDFTVVRPKEPTKGYVLILKLTKVDATTKSAKCVISGLIVEYPRQRNSKGEIGDVAVSLSLQASGGVDFTKNPVIECVDVLVEDIMGKAIPEMRRHYATRNSP
jgi:hypothetical protein